MSRVPMRTLNQDTARVLARVEAGETVEITRRGRVIGRIVPATGAGGELDDWVAAGRAVPATRSGPFVAPAGPTSGTEAGALLETLREEERW